VVRHCLQLHWQVAWRRPAVPVPVVSLRLLPVRSSASVRSDTSTARMKKVTTRMKAATQVVAAPLLESLLSLRPVGPAQLLRLPLAAPFYCTSAAGPSPLISHFMQAATPHRPKAARKKPKKTDPPVGLTTLHKYYGASGAAR
jgi:hypothetical protein